MGITQVFEGNANFSRICSKEKRLQINSVIQKTQFEIGENQEISQTSTTSKCLVLKCSFWEFLTNNKFFCK